MSEQVAKLERHQPIWTGIYFECAVCHQRDVSQYERCEVATARRTANAEAVAPERQRHEWAKHWPVCIHCGVEGIDNETEFCDEIVLRRPLTPPPEVGSTGEREGAGECEHSWSDQTFDAYCLRCGLDKCRDVTGMSSDEVDAILTSAGIDPASLLPEFQERLRSEIAKHEGILNNLRAAWAAATRGELK